ncbi:MAG: M18 family aminopeptidase [Actinomycetaceae bacterium]|nr:M18 family aminopeptidase [Actinomycetaceae bacterium]
MTEFLLDFLGSCPTSYHAARCVADRLVQTGFSEDDALVPGGHVQVYDGAVLAWFVPPNPQPGARIIGVHTDSPALKVKPVMDLPGPDGWAQIGVEVYGGPLLNSWLDRDLGIAGRLVDFAGRTHLVRTGPICRVAQLAIHLLREQSEKVQLNRQTHLQPLVGVDFEDTPVLSHLAELAGISAEDVCGHDLFTYDTQAPALIGLNGDMLASGRQDNLLSVGAGLQALMTAAPKAPSQTLILAAFDHEEVGSQTATGAAGPLLETLLNQLAQQADPSVQGRARYFAHSLCISADVAHSSHPNYPDKHDSAHRPIFGKGPVLKVNANQHYSTDALSTAFWRRAVAAAGVPAQIFASKNDVPCGTTIAPMMATRLGIRTVDVGQPILSMHSARELSCPADFTAMTKVMTAFYEGA